MRRPSLVHLIALLALFALAAGSCRESAPAGGKGPGLQVVPSMGLDTSFGGSWSTERWTALSVELAASPVELSGELRVRGRGLLVEGTTPLVEKRFTLPAGGQRRFGIPVLPLGWEAAEISFEVDGKTRVYRHELPVFPSRRTRDRRVVVVGDDLPRLDALQSELAAGLEEVAFPGDDRPERPRLRVAGVNPDALPESFSAWDPVSLVVLYAPDLSRARPQALRALEGWLQRGGNLVAFPGPGWASELPEPLPEMLGVESISPLGERPEGVPEDVATGPWYRLEAAPDARLGRWRAALEHPYGTGKSWTLAWTPRMAVASGPEGESLSSLTGIFPRRADASIVYPSIEAALQRSERFAGNAPERLRQLAPFLQQDLRELTGFSFPARDRVTWAVVLYLGFGFLLPYLFFRSRRRPELAYLVIALSSVLACYGIYRYGLLGAISSGQYEEFSVVRLAPEGELSARTSFVSLLSPEFARLEHAEPGLRAESLRGFELGRRGGARPRLRFPESERDPVELELDLRPNAPTTLALEGWVDASALVSVEAVGEGRYRVINRSPSALELSRNYRDPDQVDLGRKTSIPAGQEAIVERVGNTAGSASNSDRFEQALVGAISRSAAEQALHGPQHAWDDTWFAKGTGAGEYLILSSASGVLSLADFERQSARTIFLLELPDDGN